MTKITIADIMVLSAEALAELPPYVQRIAAELAELSGRLERLEAFTDGATFDGLEHEDQLLLIAQLSAMTAYATTLTLRFGRALNPAGMTLPTFTIGQGYDAGAAEPTPYDRV